MSVPGSIEIFVRFLVPDVRGEFVLNFNRFHQYGLMICNGSPSLYLRWGPGHTLVVDWQIRYFSKLIMDHLIHLHELRVVDHLIFRHLLSNLRVVHKSYLSRCLDTTRLFVFWWVCEGRVFSTILVWDAFVCWYVRKWRKRMKILIFSVLIEICLNVSCRVYFWPSLRAFSYPSYSWVYLSRFFTFVAHLRWSNVVVSFMFSGWGLPVLKFGGLHPFRGNLLFFCVL